jgi:hypothetical protein
MRGGGGSNANNEKQQGRRAMSIAFDKERVKRNMTSVRRTENYPPPYCGLPNPNSISA